MRGGGKVSCRLTTGVRDYCFTFFISQQYFLNPGGNLVGRNSTKMIGGNVKAGSRALNFVLSNVQY